MNTELKNKLTIRSCLIYSICSLLIFACIQPTAYAAKKKKAKQEEDKKQTPLIERHQISSHLKVSQDHDKALADQLQSNPMTLDTLEWLEGADADSFLSITREAPPGPSKGVILIIPDAGQHADWPGLTHQLRTGLTQEGFVTLSISVPSYDKPIDPIHFKRTEPASSQGESEDKKKVKKKGKKKKKKDKKTPKAQPTPQSTPQADAASTLPTDPVKQWESILKARLNALLTHAQSKSAGKQFIITSSRSAAYIIRSLAEQPLDMNGFILINFPVDEKKHAAFKAFMDYGVPTLEIITKEIGHSVHTIDFSKPQERRSQPAHYQLIPLLSQTASVENYSGFIYRVRGWLRRILNPET